MIKKIIKKIKNYKNEIIFLSPGVLITILIFIIPLLYALQKSLWRINFLRPLRDEFVGLNNYINAFTQDARFLRILYITLIFVVSSVGVSIIIGLFLAIILNRKRYGKLIIKGGNFFRMGILIPAIMAQAVSGSLLRIFVWDHDFGVVNAILRSFGLSRIGWLTQSNTAILVVILAEIFLRTSLTMLIMDAAIKNLPDEPFEAATLSGASGLQKLINITLPYIKPQLLFVLILQVTMAFHQFETVFFLTGGGPGDATRLLSLFVYETAFHRMNFGYACALGIIMLIITGAICITAIKLMGETEVVKWGK